MHESAVKFSLEYVIWSKIKGTEEISETGNKMNITGSKKLSLVSHPIKLENV